MTKKRVVKEGWDNRIFSIFVNIFLIIAGIAAFYPIWFVLIASFSEPEIVNIGEVYFLPKGFQIEGYKMFFNHKDIMTGYRNSIIYTGVGTTLNVLVTAMLAYSLSRKDMYGRTIFSWMVAIPMWLNGGLIPTYIVVSNLGLVDNPLFLILFHLVSCYNVIICRSFFNSLPYELQEAARIDGSNDFGILFKIIMPLAKPVLAVLCLYYAVAHWNDYFNAMIYLNNRDYQPLQVFLREILLLNQRVDMEAMDVEAMAEKARMASVMKYSLIVLSSAPLLVAYPFVQKHFVKGMMIGSVKG